MHCNIQCPASWQYVNRLKMYQLYIKAPRSQPKSAVLCLVYDFASGSKWRLSWFLNVLLARLRHSGSCNKIYFHLTSSVRFSKVCCKISSKMMDSFSPLFELKGIQLPITVTGYSATITGASHDADQLTQQQDWNANAISAQMKEERIALLVGRWHSFHFHHHSPWNTTWNFLLIPSELNWDPITNQADVKRSTLQMIKINPNNNYLQGLQKSILSEHNHLQNTQYFKQHLVPHKTIQEMLQYSLM